MRAPASTLPVASPTTASSRASQAAREAATPGQDPEALGAADLVFQVHEVRLEDAIDLGRRCGARPVRA